MNVKTLPISRKVMPELTEKDESLLNKGSAPLLRIKDILVPVDFSTCSRKAVVYALSFARQFGAKLTLLHVVPAYYATDPYGLTQYERIEGELRTKGEQKLNGLISELVPASTKTEAQTVNGHPGTEIVDAARDLQADLIIIATHGYTGLKHVLFGSTAEHVVRNAPCPVLTVRQKESDFVKLL